MELIYAVIAAIGVMVASFPCQTGSINTIAPQLKEFDKEDLWVSSFV
ncbi:hypothetical protein [Runella slithyformis]|nr:hypothetical protein [Runella slithyformis]